MDETLRKIVNQLTEKTKMKKVNWQMGNSSNEYRLILPESTISISVYQSSSNLAYFVEFKILNERGDVILRENTLQSTEDGGVLTNFFVLVRDTYTGKDDIISSLFRHLENDETVGEPEKDHPDLPF